MQLKTHRSDWLARMDADDLMFPNRLKIQMDFIREHPKVGLWVRPVPS